MVRESEEGRLVEIAVQLVAFFGSDTEVYFARNYVTIGTVCKIKLHNFLIILMAILV